MPSRRLKLLLVGAALVLTTAACGLGKQETPPPPPTRTPWPTFTPTPEGQVANPQLFQTAMAPQDTPTSVALPTDTPAPTPEPATPTPEPPTPEPATPTPAPPSAFANDAINVRQGPGTNYTRIGNLSPGQRYPITGKNARGDWWQIDFNGRAGWVVDSLVQKEGQIDTVQVAVDIPAPPAARPRPAATATPVPQAPQPLPTAAPQFAYSLGKGTDRCEVNVGQTYFSGFVRDRNNNAVNGVCVHVAFYGPRNTKCAGCDGVGDGVWGFSPFGGPAPAGTTVEVFIVQCPPSMPPGGQTEQTGFGNLTPQSDKWTHTFAQSEQCTGITFYKN